MPDELRNDFAVLHFEEADSTGMETAVLRFSVDEHLSTPFEVVVNFLSFEPSLPFDKIVGRGAGLTLHTAFNGERVWAGVCTELVLVNAEEHGASTELLEALDLGRHYKGASRYRMTIRPALWRLTMRKNS